MEVIIVGKPHEVIELGAEMVEKQVRDHPFSVLGLATGSTMEGVYSKLIQRELDFSHVTTFNLDEYVGLAGDDPGSYSTYMRKHLFDHVNLKRENIHLLNGTTGDIPAHCRAYEKAIVDSGGVDLQLLGIGQDGHIAFNEPGSSLASRTRLKTLTPDTLAANAPHFPTGENVPMHVLTMGIATIMEARRCLLLAYGKAKSPAIAGAVEGPITASCPASILQMHPCCTMVIDEEAAHKLARSDYYKFVYRNKP
jgi:glucosamine-6-phosphate deaminase